MRQLVALFEVPRRLGSPSREREVVHLGDAPRARHGRPVDEEFQPALWGGVRHSSLRVCGWGEPRGVSW